MVCVIGGATKDTQDFEKATIILKIVMGAVILLLAFYMFYLGF